MPYLRPSTKHEFDKVFGFSKFLHKLCVEIIIFNRSFNFNKIDELILSEYLINKIGISLTFSMCFQLFVHFEINIVANN